MVRTQLHVDETVTTWQYTKAISTILSSGYIINNFGCNCSVVMDTDILQLSACFTAVQPSTTKDLISIPIAMYLFYKKRN